MSLSDESFEPLMGPPKPPRPLSLDTPLAGAIRGALIVYLIGCTTRREWLRSVEQAVARATPVELTYIEHCVAYAKDCERRMEGAERTPSLDTRTALDARKLVVDYLFGVASEGEWTRFQRWVAESGTAEEVLYVEKCAEFARIVVARDAWHWDWPAGKRPA